MKARTIKDGVQWLGAIDWGRRLFDALIPLPDGTSYNAYLVRGAEKTVLLDAVDPTMAGILFEQLRDVPRLDYIVSQHAEQDHSGALPSLLQKYPQAQILASHPGRQNLIDLLDLPPEKIRVVKDGETLALGGKTLRFLTTPWVHWPDTMVSWLEEDRILFSCDFFGSHLATSELFAADEGRVYQAAKLYYAQIMMPFARQAAKNIEKILPLNPDMIAPSHGPIFNRPGFILDAWREWTSAPPQKMAVLPFISMHDSTRRMADHIGGALAERGVRVERFDLTRTDLGKLAVALLDASTVVLGTPAMLNAPHPWVLHAATLINALKPKTRFISWFGSYGWGAKALENIPALFPDLPVEFLAPVTCRGLPKPPDFQALDNLAQTIADKHGPST